MIPIPVVFGSSRIPVRALRPACGEKVAGEAGRMRGRRADEARGFEQEPLPVALAWPFGPVLSRCAGEGER